MTSQVRNLPFDLGPGDRAHNPSGLAQLRARFRDGGYQHGSMHLLHEPAQYRRGPQNSPAHRHGLGPEALGKSLPETHGRIDEASPLRRSLFQAARFCTCRVKRAEGYFRGQELDTCGRGLSESVRRGVAHLLRWLMLFLPYLRPGQNRPCQAS